MRYKITYIHPVKGFTVTTKWFATEPTLKDIQNSVKGQVQGYRKL